MKDNYYKIVLIFAIIVTLTFIYKVNSLQSSSSFTYTNNNIEYSQRENNSNTVIMKVTAYTSTPSQTDKTPCIGASGDICLLWQESHELLCATNDFPLGTRIFIGGEFQGECLVVDKMNANIKNTIDLYFGFDKDCLDNYQPGDICPNLIRAIEFGAKEMSIQIW